MALPQVRCNAVRRRSWSAVAIVIAFASTAVTVPAGCVLRCSVTSTPVTISTPWDVNSLALATGLA
jgi:hypothetical protein